MAAKTSGSDLAVIELRILLILTLTLLLACHTPKDPTQPPPRDHLLSLANDAPVGTNVIDSLDSTDVVDWKRFELDAPGPVVVNLEVSARRGEDAEVVVFVSDEEDVEPQLRRVSGDGAPTRVELDARSGRVFVGLWLTSGEADVVVRVEVVGEGER